MREGPVARPDDRLAVGPAVIMAGVARAGLRLLPGEFRGRGPRLPPAGPLGMVGLDHVARVEEVGAGVGPGLEKLPEDRLGPWPDGDDAILAPPGGLVPLG